MPNEPTSCTERVVDHTGTKYGVCVNRSSNGLCAACCSLMVQLFLNQTHRFFPSLSLFLSVGNVSQFALPDPAGRAGGACTSTLLKVLYTDHHDVSKELSYMQVLDQMRDVLKEQGFAQIPQVGVVVPSMHYYAFTSSSFERLTSFEEKVEENAENPRLASTVKDPQCTSSLLGCLYFIHICHLF